MDTQHTPAPRPATLDDLMAVKVGTVFLMHLPHGGDPVEVIVAGPFEYVELTDPPIYEAWALRSDNWMPDLLTWSEDSPNLTSGGADGALDGMTNERIVDKATEMRRALGLI